MKSMIGLNQEAESPSAEREPPVLLEIKILSEQLDYLDNVLERLACKIGPILTPEIPTTKNEDEEDFKMPMAPLAENLQALRLRVQHKAKFFDYLISRVEV